MDLDELEATLAAIAQIGAGDAQFAARVDAIEQLEFMALACATDDLPARAVAIGRQAQALREQLEQQNEQLFQRLRGYARAGDAAALRRVFAASDGAAPAAAGVELEYDQLDVLLSGMLHFAPIDASDCMWEAEMVDYQPTPVRIILELIQQTQPHERDVIVDIGSGLGHVPILVALLTAARAVGIERQPAYCAAALRVVQQLGIARVELRCEDARVADVTTGTIFYLYTPFTGAMLHAVLARLHSEALRRRIRLCTYGPQLAAVVTNGAFPAFSAGVSVAGGMTIFTSEVQ